MGWRDSEVMRNGFHPFVSWREDPVDFANRTESRSGVSTSTPRVRWRSTLLPRFQESPWGEFFPTRPDSTHTQSPL